MPMRASEAAGKREFHQGVHSLHSLHTKEQNGAGTALHHAVTAQGKGVVHTSAALLAQHKGCGCHRHAARDQQRLRPA